jgi:hypothetical protein
MFATINLDYSTPGNDLNACLRHAKGDTKIALGLHATRLRDVATHLDGIVKILKSHPDVIIEIDADEDGISLDGPEVVIKALLDKRLVELEDGDEDEEDEEEEDELGDDDDEEEEEEDTDDEDDEEEQK